MKAVIASAILACIPTPLASLLAHAPQMSAPNDAPIAVEQMAIGGPEQRMALVIWHPAASGTTADGGKPGTIANVSSNRRPLVIISHGTGAGPMAHVDTAEALARAGFVVAAPMHRGDNFQDESSVGRPEWMANRSRDVSDAIDYMLGEWAGRAQLDGSRVGIFGLSAGATTALIAAGGVPDLARVAAHCAAQQEFVCKIMVPQSEVAGAAPPRWTNDRRIAAAVLAAPGLGFTFEPTGLDAVKIPVQLWVGGADQIVPYASNAGIVRRLLRGPVDFHNVDNAVHLSFLAPCGPDGPRQLCEDNPGFDRAAFHREFNRSVVDFFQRNLRGTGDGGR
jgi:predicted dienelactone hydrolase